MTQMRAASSTRLDPPEDRSLKCVPIDVDSREHCRTERDKARLDERQMRKMETEQIAAEAVPTTSEESGMPPATSSQPSAEGLVVDELPARGQRRKASWYMVKRANGARLGASCRP